MLHTRMHQKVIKFPTTSMPSASRPCLSTHGGSALLLLPIRYSFPALEAPVRVQTATSRSRGSAGDPRDTPSRPRHIVPPSTALRQANAESGSTTLAARNRVLHPRPWLPPESG